MPLPVGLMIQLPRCMHARRYGSYGSPAGMHGARVVVLRQGQDPAHSATWIRQEDGTQLHQAAAERVSGGWFGGLMRVGLHAFALCSSSQLTAGPAWPALQGPRAEQHTCAYHEGGCQRLLGAATCVKLQQRLHLIVAGALAAACTAAAVTWLMWRQRATQLRGYRRAGLGGQHSGSTCWIQLQGSLGLTPGRLALK